MTTGVWQSAPAEAKKNVAQTKALLSEFDSERCSLIPILQKVQAKLGFIPAEAMLAVAEHLSIPAVEVYGVVTFYNQLRLNPPGRHSVKVCLGTACHMKGGYIALDAWQRRLMIQSGETTSDREYDLDKVACVGCCTLAPVSVVDEKTEARCDPTRVDGLMLGFEQAREKRQAARLRQTAPQRQKNAS
jgi:NADH-quinone oxidoreductase subunit E